MILPNEVHRRMWKNNHWHCAISTITDALDDYALKSLCTTDSKINASRDAGSPRLQFLRLLIFSLEPECRSRIMKSRCFFQRFARGHTPDRCTGDRGRFRAGRIRKYIVPITFGMTSFKSSRQQKCISFASYPQLRWIVAESLTKQPSCSAPRMIQDRRRT